MQHGRVGSVHAGSLFCRAADWNSCSTADWNLSRQMMCLQELENKFFEFFSEFIRNIKNIVTFAQLTKKRCLFTAVLIEVGKAFYGIGNVS